MEKRIEYQGMTSQPSDYVCPDGDMKLAVNAEFRDGGWKAVKEVNEKKYCKKHIVYIHVLPDNQENIILYVDDDELKAEKNNTTVEFSENIKYDLSFKVNSVGKCLIVLISKQAFVFAYTSNKYELISNFDIRLNIQFFADISSKYNNYPVSTKGWLFPRTKYSYMNKSSFSDIINYDNNLKTTEDLDEYGDPNEAFMQGDTASDVFFGELNKQISTYEDIKLFIYPRLIQYAIRLYDNTLILASPRILIYPVEDPIFLGVCNYIGGFENRMYYPATQINNNYTDYEYNLRYLNLFYNTYKIKAKLLNAQCDELKKLKTLFSNNIIKSIDIFLSNNIVTNRNKYIYAIKQQKTTNGYGYLPFIPKKKKTELKNEIDAMPLYLVRSLNIDEICSMNEPIDLLDSVSVDVIKNLEQRETIDDSTIGINSFIVNGLMMYNSRTILFDFARNNYSIPYLDVMSPSIFFNGKSPLDIDAENEIFKYAFPDVYDAEEEIGLYLQFAIKSEAIVSHGIYGDICETKENSTTTKLLLPLYFNVGCHTSLRGEYIFKTQEVTQKTPLEISWFRNSLFYLYFNAGEIPIENTDNIPSESIHYNEYNAVTFSNVDNPIAFGQGSVIYCGNGRVLSLVTNSISTSQGQFGQYPLYAFGTDGVYSIGIGTDGTLQNCVPLSYDILTDKHSVGKMEQVVVFATREGIIALSGSERKVLLSADKEADYTYDNDKQKEFITNTVNDVVGITPPQMTDLYTYITTGVRFAFDANHGRLIAFNPAYDYSYIMDAKTNNWSVFYKGFDSVLNIPEQCLLVRKETNEDGETEYNVYDYSSDEVVDIQKSYFITRPFKLDMPDVHKSIQSIIQRGVFCDRKDVQQALYGSNDLYNWNPVWSSKDIYLRGMRGSGYKYYKLAIFIPEFKQDEILHGCSVEFTPRLTNKPR